MVVRLFLGHHSDQPLTDKAEIGQAKIAHNLTEGLIKRGVRVAVDRLQFIKCGHQARKVQDLQSRIGLGIYKSLNDVDIAANSIFNQLFAGTELRGGKVFDLQSDIGVLDLLDHVLHDLITKMFRRPGAGYLQSNITGKSGCRYRKGKRQTKQQSPNL